MPTTPHTHPRPARFLRGARAVAALVMVAAICAGLAPVQIGALGRGAPRAAAEGGDGAWVLLGPPPARHDHTAVWDPVMQQLLIFGGDLNDLWSYRPDRNSWAELHPTGGPPSVRRVHTAVWDSANNQMLVFGGTGGGGDLNDLWAYKPAGNTWTQLSPSGDLPPARWGHSAVWDATDGQMLVFGGEQSSGGYLNDLWSYRPATNAWKLLTPFNLAGAPPAARSGQVAVWDPIGRQMVIFSGATAPTTFSTDVWVYSPVGNIWAQKFPTGGPSTGRWRSTAVWDSTANRMLVFGGWQTCCTTGSLKDLWSYDPAINHWAQVSPSGSIAARAGQAAAWDSNDGQMMVFGGVTGSTNYNDLWAYQPGGNAWVQEYLTGVPRIGNATVWDSANRQMIIFGGSLLDVYGNLGREPKNDLWIYQPANNSWKRLPPTGAIPPNRYSHAAIWDIVNKQMLIFNGYNSNGYLNDVWSYHPNDNSWLEIDNGVATPIVVDSNGIVWDNTSNRVLIFKDSQTWGFDQSSSSWNQFNQYAGSHRHAQSVAWDPISSQMIIFGGYQTFQYSGGYSNSMWAFRPAANAWLDLNPSGSLPPYRMGATAVWDDLNNRMLVFGGGGYRSHNFQALSDLWSYDPLANSWAQLLPPSSPPGRIFHTAAWDTVYKQMLIFGGCTGYADLCGSAINDLWAYRPAGGPVVRLRLDPSPAPVTLGATTEVRIYAETGTQQLDGVQLRLTFDAAKLQVVDADAGTGGVQITPSDAFGNILTNTADNATGTVDLALGRLPGATAPGGSVLLGTVTIRGTAAGVWPLSFTSGNVEAAFGGGTLPYSLDDGAVQVVPTHLRVTQQPIRGVHIRAPGVQPTIAVADAVNATVTGDNATVVTLAIVPGTGAAGATLTCDQTISGVPSMAVAAGVAQFTGCVINQPGAGYILEATAPGLAAVRTDPFNITWAGDTNGDCRVSVVDYSLVVTHFGKTPADPDWTNPAIRAYRADVNGDLRVGALSYSIVITLFGTQTGVCVPASDGNPTPSG